MPATNPAQPDHIHIKTSFAPIADDDTTILILGSLPGDKSLEMGEYYGHSRNRFWQTIATLCNCTLPNNYTGKQQMLLQNKIGIWDVAHQATRKGSLDSAITAEAPNDLNHFLDNHSHIKVIGFNGKKSEALFNKYFQRRAGIRYVSLPSTSPANAGIRPEKLLAQWQQIL